MPALLLRIGFVGEVGYEIHCPAPQATHLWDAILASGRRRRHPVRPGAPAVLRLQKLHVIVGQDTDSESTPFNTGMDWTVKLDKPQDFIGRWALEARANRTTADAARRLHRAERRGDGRGRRRAPRTASPPVPGDQLALVAPQLGASIGMATVPAELAADGADDPDLLRREDPPRRGDHPALLRPRRRGAALMNLDFLTPARADGAEPPREPDADGRGARGRATRGSRDGWVVPASFGDDATEQHAPVSETVGFADASSAAQDRAARPASRALGAARRA